MQPMGEGGRAIHERAERSSWIPWMKGVALREASSPPSAPLTPLNRSLRPRARASRAASSPLAGVGSSPGLHGRHNSRNREKKGVRKGQFHGPGVRRELGHILNTGDKTSSSRPGSRVDQKENC